MYWVDDNHLKIQQEKFSVYPTEPSEIEQRKKQEEREDASPFDLNKSCSVSAF